MTPIFVFVFLIMIPLCIILGITYLILSFTSKRKKDEENVEYKINEFIGKFSYKGKKTKDYLQKFGNNYFNYFRKTSILLYGIFDENNKNELQLSNGFTTENNFQKSILVHEFGHLIQYFNGGILYYFNFLKSAFFGEILLGILVITTFILKFFYNGTMLYEILFITSLLLLIIISITTLMDEIEASMNGYYLLKENNITVNNYGFYVFMFLTTYIFNYLILFILLAY